MMHSQHVDRDARTCRLLGEASTRPIFLAIIVMLTCCVATTRAQTDPIDVLIDEQSNITAILSAVRGVEVLRSLTIVDSNLTTAEAIEMLSHVTNVTGTIKITGENPHLDSVSIALASLRTVGGSLMLTEHDHWNELNLPDLHTVTGSLSVSLRATKVVRMDALVNAGAISIHSCYRVVTVSMPKVSTVLGKLEFWQLEQMAHLDMHSLHSVTGDLVLNRPRALRRLGFQNLVTIGGDLYIDAADLMGVVVGLEQLRRVGRILVRGCALLSNLCGLDGVTQADELIISNVPSLGFVPQYLATLAGIDMPNCESLPEQSVTLGPSSTAEDVAQVVAESAGHTHFGHIIIEENAAITNDQLSEMLSAVTIVHGAVSIRLNPKLTHVRGALDKLQIIQGDLRMAGEFEELVFPSLLSVGSKMSLEPLTPLRTLSAPALVNVTGDLTMRQMPGVRIISLPSLELIGGGFVQYDVKGNSAMDLKSLTRIDGHVDLYNSHQLVDLGMSSLVSIGQTLRLHNLQQITEIVGLESLTAVKSITITTCFRLFNLCGLNSLVEVESFVTDLTFPVLPSILANLLGVNAVNCENATFVVSSTADSGSGTLREALTNANARLGPDRILYSGPEAAILRLQSALPFVTGKAQLLLDGLQIDGSLGIARGLEVELAAAGKHRLRAQGIH